MARYLGGKLVNAILIFLAATICIFAMVKLAGLNPVLATISGGNISEETLANRMAKYGLDQPIVLQYLYWLKNICLFNFGESVKYKVPVLQLIQTAAPVTIFICLISFVISQGIALGLGIWSAVKYNTTIDRVITILTLLLFSIPIFFAGMIAILILNQYFPEVSYSGSLNTMQDYAERLLPAILIMIAHNVALITKVTRTSMLKQLHSDYMLTLRAKGLAQTKIIFRHGLKNAIIPVLTISGVQFGSMIVGTVLVENIFSLSGLGRLIVASVTVGDVAVIQGVSIITILVFLIVNFLVDTLYAVIDPRVKEAGVIA